jgi:hypothetical protein
MTRSRSCLHSPITPNFNASALHSPVYDQAALVASGWAAYLQLVYGDFSRLEYPFAPSSLSVLYPQLLNLSGVRVPAARECRREMPEGFVYRERMYLESPSYVHVSHKARDALPSGTWVEVSHCTVGWHEGGYWTYHSPGSGMYINTGRTVAFAGHQEAAAFFGSKTALLARANGGNAVRHGARGGAGEVNEMKFRRAAAAAGYDTVQLLRWADQACGNLAVEILHTRAVGKNTCGPPMRTGWGATRPCNCSAIEGPNWSFLRQKERDSRSCPAGAIRGGWDYDSFDVCCPASCGKCGGDGCESRPGGRTACCVKDVQKTAPPCATNGWTPPCANAQSQQTIMRYGGRRRPHVVKDNSPLRNARCAYCFNGVALRVTE